MTRSASHNATAPPPPRCYESRKVSVDKHYSNRDHRRIADSDDKPVQVTAGQQALTGVTLLWTWLMLKS